MAIPDNVKNPINKVSKALKKASNLHAKQAKTLETIKLKKGGSVPSNVSNPSLYSRVKAAAKAVFDVYPSAYANMWASKTQKAGKC